MNKTKPGKKPAAPKTGAGRTQKEKDLKPANFSQRFPLPFAYICAPDRNDEENLEKIRRYCRLAIANYYIPIAPQLYFPSFLRDEIECERGLRMYCSSCLEDKCQEVWICGESLTDSMKGEIWRAKMRGKGFRMFTDDMKEVR